MRLDDFRLQFGKKEYRALIIGGMGVDISTAALALEASKNGAIGHISDAMSPYISDRRFRTRFQHDKLVRIRSMQKENPDAEIRWDPEDVYRATKLHTGTTMEQKRGDGAVFINVMEKLGMGNPKETLRARLRGAIDGGIDGITLSAGLHNGTLQLIDDHPRFHDVLFGIIVSSARALKIFLRSAGRSNRLPDYIIVEGPLAGGHLGFGPDWREHCLQTIVLEVMQMLRESDLQIPVIPAGGIFTNADAVKFMNLGAAAVQVATRFTITRECGLPANVKQIYLDSEEDDVVVNMSSPAGYPMRMLRSSPSLRSNIKPNCEALGYMLDGNGHCAYRDAYAATPVDAQGRKLPVTDKMCICHHFMQYQCYTCGHNVFKLKETTYRRADGTFYLPTAAEVIAEYLTGRNRVLEDQREFSDRAELMIPA
jgi:nitronate monooxygenase